MSDKKKRKPVDFSPDTKNCEMILAESRDERLTCATVFLLSEKLGISKAAAGNYADYLELRLSKCQIGLFGHGEKRKLVRKLDNPDEKVLGAITVLKDDGKISCANVFKIAVELQISPQAVANVCQSTGVKIKDCQIGAF